MYNLAGVFSRICHCEAEFEAPLVAPCCCAGSLKYVNIKFYFPVFQSFASFVFVIVCLGPPGMSAALGPEFRHEKL